MRAAIAGAVLLLLLAGCTAPGPDLQARAAADFEALLAEADRVDAATLRTLEREQPRPQPCGPESSGEQTAHVATGILSITAEEDAGAAMLDDLAESLDDERWKALQGDTELEAQRAFVDPDGIVATITLERGLLVIAVFGPCG